MLEGASFKTTTGAPQRDALSPILLIIYPETIMGEQKPNQFRRPATLYADDLNSLYYDCRTEKRHEASPVEGMCVLGTS